MATTEQSRPASQKLPAGLAGVLNPSDDNRDSAYYSSTDASSKRKSGPRVGSSSSTFQLIQELTLPPCCRQTPQPHHTMLSMSSVPRMVASTHKTTRRPRPPPLICYRSL